MSKTTDYLAKKLGVSLEKLKDRHTMSDHTYHICQLYDLVNLGNLLDYYYQNNTFSTLTQANEEMEKELLNICSVYLFDTRMAAYFTTKYADLNYHLYQELTDKQIHILDLFIKKRLDKLSVRANNVLNRELERHIDFQTIRVRFFNDKKSIKKIYYSGEKIGAELLDFINAVEAYALAMLLEDEERLEANDFMNNLCHAFKLPKPYLEPYISKIKEHSFPLFTFLQRLLLEGKLMDEKRITIMKARLGYFTNEENKSLERLGEKLGLTKEHVGQILVSIERDFNKSLALLNNCKAGLAAFCNYPIDALWDTPQCDCQYITMDQAGAINQAENCFFTSKFMLFVFTALHRDTHVLFTNSHKFFKQYYSICRELTEEFNFNAFFDNILTKIQRQIIPNETINYDQYLNAFLKKGAELSPRIKKVCTTIIEKEFTEGVIIDAEGNLIFQQNKMMDYEYLYQYILEVLEERGEPMTLGTMKGLINQKYPDCIESRDTLRTIMKEEPLHFVVIGKTGKYGLVKWGKERTAKKIDSVSSLAEKYLISSDTLKHITDILDYVQLFQPDTNLKTIMTLLSLPHPYLIAFKDDFWGLSYKTYPNT